MASAEFCHIRHSSFQPREESTFVRRFGALRREVAEARRKKSEKAVSNRAGELL
jgi:hypothetical protein